MPFKKGGGRLGGRGKGTPNKLTTSAREAFALAFDGLGGYEALQRWAKKNPTEFFKLYARLIPIEHTGKEGGPIATIVRHVYETVTGETKEGA